MRPWLETALVLVFGLFYLYGWYLMIGRARSQGRRILPLVLAGLLLSPWLILIAIREPTIPPFHPRIHDAETPPASGLLAASEGVR